MNNRKRPRLSMIEAGPSRAGKRRHVPFSLLSAGLLAATASAQPGQTAFKSTVPADIRLNAVTPVPGLAESISVGSGRTRVNVETRMQFIRHDPAGKIISERLWRVPDVVRHDLVGTGVAVDPGGVSFVAAQTTFDLSPPDRAFGNTLISFFPSGSIRWSMEYLGPGFLSQSGPAVALTTANEPFLAGTALRPGGAPGNRGLLVRANPANGAPIIQKLVSATLVTESLSVNFTDIVRYAVDQYFIVGYTTRGAQRDIILMLTDANATADPMITKMAIVDLPTSDESNISVDANGPDLIITAASKEPVGSPEALDTIVLRVNPLLPSGVDPLLWARRIPRFVVGPQGVTYLPGPPGVPSLDQFALTGTLSPASDGVAAQLMLDSLGNLVWSRSYGTSDREELRAITLVAGELFSVGGLTLADSTVDGYAVRTDLLGNSFCLDASLDLGPIPILPPIRPLTFNIEDFMGNAPVPLELIRRLEDRDLCCRCLCDLNCDGSSDFADFLEFFNCYDSELPCADVDGNPGVDFADFLEFFNCYDVGC